MRLLLGLLLVSCALGQTPEVEPEQPLPRRICLIVDTSGSMASGALERALAFVQRLITFPVDDLRVAVISFATGVRVRPWCDLPDAEQVEGIRAFLAVAGPSGDTHLLPALARAAELEPDAVVIVTDGLLQRDRPAALIEAALELNCPVWSYVIAEELPRYAQALVEAARRTGGGCYRP